MPNIAVTLVELVPSFGRSELRQPLLGNVGAIALALGLAFGMGLR